MRQPHFDTDDYTSTLMKNRRRNPIKKLNAATPRLNATISIKCLKKGRSRATEI
jgi:hypothetical protein